MRRLLLGILSVWLVNGSCMAWSQIETRPLIHNGYSRPYIIYRPDRLPPSPSVVFMLGGIRSTALSTSQDYGWMAEADRNKFIVVFPDPVATRPDEPPDRKQNVTFWEMNGSRTHKPASGMSAVDDDGYLMAVLREVLSRDHPDRRRIFFAGFSSGSGMVQLFASRHPGEVSAIAAVATPLMDPPSRLAHPVPVLYIHGDEDEQVSGFEVHRPNYATTPHGNWVTWGYLDGCHIQTAKKTEWGVQFMWQECKNRVPVIADFVAGLGHEWEGSQDFHESPKYPLKIHLDFTDMAWQFFAGVPK